MMRSPQLLGDGDAVESLTPNLRFIMYCKAHAARRVTSRPWAADEYLCETISMFCRGRGSPARLIQNSPELRRRFCEFVRNAADTPLQRAVSGFCAAPHRFDSYQKPLGRTCIYLKACIQTMIHLSQKADDYGTRAKAWLTWVDEERCLQASMLSDASDKSMVHVRLLDAENVDQRHCKGSCVLTCPPSPACSTMAQR